MGFEAQPQIADLEIAATWDEIELEAALMGRGAGARNPSSPAMTSCVSETLRAVKELQRLPKAERKRRAEELLRALTSVPPARGPEHRAAPDLSNPTSESPALGPRAGSPDLSERREQAVLAEPSPLPVTPAARYAIPKFLATECPSREPEHPDSLIPLRTAAAASAVIGAVLLIYFGSSPEFGVAARPIIGGGELSETRAAPPEVPPTVAVRQAFVAEPLAYSAASEPVRSYHPPFVGFDLGDAVAPPIDASAGPLVSPAQIVPQSHAEETAALPPPAPDADPAALIDRGDALLKAGDVAAARSAFERAAAGGSSQAAIGVGKTYDPLVLAKIGARGVRGDPVQAASWYARAGEAGDEEGQQRLHALLSGLSDCMLSKGACGSRKP